MNNASRYAALATEMLWRGVHLAILTSCSISNILNCANARGKSTLNSSPYFELKYCTYQHDSPAVCWSHSYDPKIDLRPKMHIAATGHPPPVTRPMFLICNIFHRRRSDCSPAIIAREHEDRMGEKADVDLGVVQSVADILVRDV